MAQEPASRQGASVLPGDRVPVPSEGVASLPPDSFSRSHSIKPGLLLPLNSDLVLDPLSQERKALILDHLDRICRSPSFESSKRCQQFLRYVIAETLSGRGELIKERNIASEVFGKGIEFEPGEDSVVRVKAREVRKRLSDFYRLEPSDSLRIELPLGGYSPRICVSSPPGEEVQSCFIASPPPARRFSRRSLLGLLGGAIATAGSIEAWRKLAQRGAPLDRLWRPVFATRVPLVIFIPILTERIGGAITDRVGIGPAAALRHAADFLDQHNYPYHLRFGSDLTFALLREQPSLLLGGFSSLWALLLTQKLRFSLTLDERSGQQAIVDTQTKQVWRPANVSSEGYANEDYGLLCRLFDHESGQTVMLAGGITTFGTEGAASVFFDSRPFAELIKQAPQDWEKRNIEAVIRVSIRGTTPSIPQLIAARFW